MGGASLTVLKIEKVLKKEIFEKPEFSLKEQTTFDAHGNEISDLGIPETKIEKRFMEAGLIHYKAKMSTETIKQPIYIYDDRYVEWVKGYQKIENFEFWIKEDFSNLYVFAPKQIADMFVHRMTKERYVTCNKLQFDFSKVGELENLDSAWGEWEDSQGIIRRIARFGKGIESEIKDFSPITTFYIDYKYGSKIIQLILGGGGRISTFSTIKYRDLLVLYNEISKILLK